MTPAARIAAAIEVLADIEARRRPAPDALKDWGLARRFAGSKDRAAVASLVYDALRCRASAAFLMGADTPRAVVIGMLARLRNLDAAAIAGLFSGERHAPEPLTQEEAARLSVPPSLADAPAHVAGDFPEWLAPSFAAAFGEAAIDEMQAMVARAPLDIRVNTLTTTREALAGELEHFAPRQTPHSADGLRFTVGEDGRGPSLQSEPSFLDGQFEIQDEGSQLAARLTLARPGERIVDLCAGAGGKTLALAALMQNGGALFATDVDTRRLVPLHGRVARSGASHVEVRSPKGRYDPARPDPLADLAGSIDCVVVDAPCTGTGTWRRNPDAKWRLRPGALAERVKDQAVVLDRAARLVRPGGRIAYITCSLLPEENDGAVTAFMGRHAGFAVAPVADVLAAAGLPSLPHRETPAGGILLTPRVTGTDGFFVTVLRRL
ncbi:MULTISPECIES: RsmB/NOP family class I SAM-dependent RNA methyltransferase [unclassified Chelatococcus]|uniref:RsmB/NOP family class I SAM-dependent RNA methyltransferase n=1 Tax=unclassified Chelatococcus TaxID=2638111 RepID=UPI0002E39C27|nr:MULTISPECIES: RsmB/NOP family class I SAM-dependent RNA methyltransferase [unclassified Chelatococcus]ALA18507.1 MFS transporter [Chelatococcus sp. CO-6]